MSIVIPLSLLLVSSVLADYEVEVTIHSYQNPTGRCDGCRQSGTSNPGCCDEIVISPASQSCSLEDTCDTSVDYCIRDVRSTADSCRDGEAILSTFSVEETNTYSMSPSFFGVENPLLIIGQNKSWTGIQLLLEIQDAVLAFNGFSEVVLIDRIAIDIDTPVGASPEATIYTGNANIAQVNASFEVRCAENFTGWDCLTLCPDFQSCAECGLPEFSGQFCHVSNNCTSCNSSNVQCTSSASGSYLCTCDPGFTGEDCEIEINYCVGEACSNNGRCRNSLGSFTCTCNRGYTGILCEAEVDECEFVTCTGNGRCIDGLDSFVCECDEGFSGLLCESENQVSTSSNEGTASTEDDVVRDSLQGNSTTTVTPGNFHYFVGGALGVLVVLVVLCALLFIILSMLIKSRRSAEILSVPESMKNHYEDPVVILEERKLNGVT